jgi:uncharacterized membrane protein
VSALYVIRARGGVARSTHEMVLMVAALALVCVVFWLLGIAKAKAAGVYKGRPASIDPAQVRQLKAEGWGPSQIARKLGIARASVYRALEGH